MDILKYARNHEGTFLRRIFDTSTMWNHFLILKNSFAFVHVVLMGKISQYANV